MIRFRALGAVELLDAAGRSLHPVLAQPKRLALLAYLAMASPRGFHRRDTLMGLFWPEMDDERARGALNQAVYHLRQSLGRDVIVSRGPADLGVDSARLWCDVAAFEDALAAGDARHSLDLYGGDLLKGFFLSDAVEWERWLEEERARLRVRAADGAWGLAEAAADAGIPGEAAFWGRRSVALASGDEHRLRQLITLLDETGDRVGAVGAYEEAVERWSRDAGIEPSPETRELIARIRSPQQDAGDKPRPTSDSATEPADEAEEVAQAIVHSADELPQHVKTGAAATRDDESRRTGGRASLIAATIVAAALFVPFFLWPRGGRIEEPGPSAAGGALAVAGSDESAAPPSASAVPPEAHAEYLKGRHFLAKLDAAAFNEARNHFEWSLDLDPTFAPAWSGLASAFNQLTSITALPAGEAYPRARAAAERALELDPDLAEAHAALAMTLSMYYWDTDGAERHFRRAIALDPGSARARRSYATHLRNLGRFDEALAQIEHAQSVDPFFAFSYVEEGLTLYCARRYDEALDRFQHFVLVAPGLTHAHVFIALVRAEKGQYHQALEALDEMDPQRTNPDAHAIRGIVYARMGRIDDARRMLAALEALSKEPRAVSAFHMAAIHVALGDHDQALHFLEQAVERPTWHMRLLGVVPTFDALRPDPRFQALLRRVGLAG